MNWIMLVIAFMLGAMVMFVMFCMGYTAKLEELENKVHFYVAREKDGVLRLYMGKPIRCEGMFVSSWKKRGKCIGRGSDLAMFCLNENDYEDLKWEDEPLEVFVNMED